MTRAQYLGTIFLVLLVIGSTATFVFRNDGRSNLHVLQADAFLKGRLDIGNREGDVSIIGDRAYVPFPSAPAAFLVPIVAMVGTSSTNTPLIALLLTIGNIGLLHAIFLQLGVERRLHFWLIVGFCLGTGYWLAIRAAGGVWYFAHIFATTFMLLAIREAFGQGRGWLVGLFVGVAFLSRQLMLFSAVFIAAALMERIPEERRMTDFLRKLLGLVASLSVCIVISMVLNYLRFGNPFDSGYSYIPLDGFLKARGEAHGLFNLVYVPFNLIYMLVQGFHVDFGSPDRLQNLVVDPFGTSILSASPFVLLALYADRRRRLVQSAWISIAAVFLVQVFYFCNGWVQINTQRYTLDVWPVIIVLVALGLAKRSEAGEERLWFWAIGYAVALNTLAGGMGFVNRGLSWWLG